MIAGTPIFIGVAHYRTLGRVTVAQYTEPDTGLP